MVIWTTCVTVGIDPKRTTFKAIFMHTSYSGANWLALFQSVCRANRHCGDTEYPIHALLTCEPFALDSLERRVSAEAHDRSTYGKPTLARARRMIESETNAHQSA